MTGDPQTTTLVVQQPLAAALKTIRAALSKQGLEIAVEVDLSARINRSLRLNLPPCRVLCVDCPLAVLEAITLDRSAAVLLPMHLVISSQGEETVIHLLNSTAALYYGLPIPARAPVSKLQAKVAEALESVATRQNPLEISA
jgi:uncharacterized protein (DUF302 family)